ncbi:MAG: TonB-dependent receptor, partial [bacterium]|nr:TonB-dependent receptor [bacterium]
MKHKLLILLVAATLAFGGMLFGQEQTGEIIGTIVLEDGSAIPGVAVEITGSKLVGKRTTVTTEVGSFRLMGLPPGGYNLTFTLEGFKTIKRRGIEVQLGRTIKLNVVMEMGNIRQEVVVEGKSPTIDVRKSATAMNVTKTTFEKLPKGRNFATILQTQPGLNYESEFDSFANDDSERRDRMGLSFDGASASENMFYVDGVDTTTLQEGVSGQNINFDFVEEVQVKSSGYAAEYGGSMGGVINVITRSGGNEFHGSLNMYFEGSALRGSRRPSLRLNPDDTSIAEYITYGDDNWNRMEPGVGIGGFLIKDRLWFFGSFLPSFKTTNRDAEFQTDPSQNAEYTRKDTEINASMKLTGQISKNLRMSVSGTLNNTKWEGDLPALDGSDNPDGPFADTGYKFPSLTASGSLDYTVGNNLIINATAGYWRTEQIQMLQPDVGVRNYMMEPSPDGKYPVYWSSYGFGTGQALINDLEDKLTGTLDFTYYFNAGGEHVLKGGYQLVRIGIDLEEGLVTDYCYYYWGHDYQSPNLGNVSTNLGYVEILEPYGTQAAAHSIRQALYMQDSWTLNDKLTLNFGVRLEKEDIPSFSDEPGYEEAPVAFGFFDKVAPRVGFAYDVNGDSSLKFFGSFGIYYDVMKLSMPVGSYGGDKWVSTYYDIVNLDYENKANVDHPATSYQGGAFLEALNWRLPSYETTQPDMKPYSKMEVTFGMEKKISEDVSFTGRVLYNTILDAIEDIGFQTSEGETYFNGNPGSDWIQQKFNESQAAGLMPMGVIADKAQRKYASVMLQLNKRFSNNWLGGVSYIWSRLTGNFSGLSSSEEHGRKDPNVQRFFDAWFLHRQADYNQSTGTLPTDRTHQFKVYGAYAFDFGLTVGANAMAMSGTPISEEWEINRQDGYYPYGRGNQGRAPFVWRLDMYAEYNLKLSEAMTLQLNANITNITNNDIAQKIFNQYNRNVIYVEEDVMYGGGNGYDFAGEMGSHQ